MLLELKVRNLAIIESIEISFGPGVNVITGETGAGKSILLAALNLILGGRSDRELIRTGEEEASVEAVFDCNPQTQKLLHEWGIEAVPEEPLMLRRTITSAGRSRGYVNCSSVPAGSLRQLAPFLIDFGRQHEQSVLMDSERHIELLDRYIGAQQLSEEVEKAHRHVVSLLKEEKKLRSEKAARAEKLDFLRFQKQAITSVDPQPNEEQELTKELEKLNSVEQCRDLARRAEYELYNKNGSIQEQFANAISTVEELVELDDSLTHVMDDLHNALIAIEEAARSLHGYQKTLSADPQEIADLQERLDQIIALQQRYGGNHEGVIKRLREIEEELRELKEQEQRLQKLAGLIATAREKLAKEAFVLSQKRQKAAKKLSQLLKRELTDLGMENTQFEIAVSSVAAEDGTVVEVQAEGQKRGVASWGMENIHFLFSANKGEELRALERVASGGELSRIMLALKRITGESFDISTFVFDEIDSGISGKVAGMVAQKLRQIVSSKDIPLQVICISHTPQVAAEADYHFLAQKQVKGERTSAQICAMDYEQRIEELSRMLAGDQSKEQALALAQELIRK